MKKKIVKMSLGLFFIMLLMLGGVTAGANADDVSTASEQASVKQEIPKVVVDNDGMKGREKWNSFVKETHDNKAASIRIEYKLKSEVMGEIGRPLKCDDVFLKYDGEKYYYVSGDSKETYKYLLELTGRSPNAACDSTYVILSNEEYSFNEVNKSIYSSNSNDHIPYTLLFTGL